MDMTVLAFQQEHQLCVDTRCSLDDFPGALGNREAGEIVSQGTEDLMIMIGIECPRGVMVKALNCGIKVTEFKLQLRYYINFWTNTLEKGMNPLYPPSYGLSSTTTAREGWIWH